MQIRILLIIIVVIVMVIIIIHYLRYHFSIKQNPWTLKFEKSETTQLLLFILGAFLTGLLLFPYMEGDKDINNSITGVVVACFCVSFAGFFIIIGGIANYLNKT